MKQLSFCDPQSEQPFSFLPSVPVKEVQIVRYVGQECAPGYSLVCVTIKYLCVFSVCYHCQQNWAILPQCKELSFKQSQEQSKRTRVENLVFRWYENSGARGWLSDTWSLRWNSSFIWSLIVTLVQIVLVFVFSTLLYKYFVSKKAPK